MWQEWAIEPHNAQEGAEHTAITKCLKTRRKSGVEGVFMHTEEYSGLKRRQQCYCIITVVLEDPKNIAIV